MKVARYICIAIIFFGIGLTAYSIPIPLLTVNFIAEKSDLIVVGKITMVAQKAERTINIGGRSVPVRVMKGEILIDRVIKGLQGVKSIPFEFELPSESLGYRAVTAGTYRILFLKQNGSEYIFTSPYYPSLAAVPDILPRDGSILDNVGHQLVAVLNSPNRNEEQKHENLFALKTLRNEEVIAALKNVMTGAQPELQLMACAALLEQNDISGLPTAEKALTNPQANIPSYLIHNIAAAIRTGIHDERAISILNRLMRLPDVQVRRAAATALWSIHSDAVKPALISGLNDEDFEVRYYAVAGLAELSDQPEWHPNMEVFQKDETKYLQYWRSWARQNF